MSFEVLMQISALFVSAFLATVRIDRRLIGIDARLSKLEKSCAAFFATQPPAPP